MNSAFNSNSQKAERFETIPVYTASSRTTRMTQRNPDLNTNKTNTNKA